MKCFSVLLMMVVLLFADMKPQDITYMTEHYPPNNYVDEYGTLRGFSVDLLKELWKEMECPEQKIHVYPWARGYMNIQSYEKQMLFTMIHTEARDSLFKWVGPVSSFSVILMGKANGADSIVISDLSELSKYKVGVIRSDAGEQILLDKGVSARTMVQSIALQDMMEKLNKGKVDIVCTSDKSLEKLRENSSGNYYKIITIDHINDYFAFSKDIPDALIKEFQTALDAIDTTHKKLMNKWGVTLEKK